jgi:hypothetical protein
MSQSLEQYGVITKLAIVQRQYDGMQMRAQAEQSRADELHKMLVTVTAQLEKMRVDHQLELQAEQARAGIATERLEKLELAPVPPAPPAPPAPNEKECVVCLNTNVDGWICLQPCMHVCVCKGCSVVLTTCPLCQTPIETKVTVYI